MTVGGLVRLLADQDHTLEVITEGCDCYSEPGEVVWEIPDDVKMYSEKAYVIITRAGDAGESEGE